MYIQKYKIFILLEIIVSYVFYIALYSSLTSNLLINKNTIFVLSWVGIITIIVHFIIWWRVSGKLFTLFNVFLAFFALFNFGQCFLWAFGIYPKSDISNTVLFSTVRTSNVAVIKAQLIFIIAFIFLNDGALLLYSQKYKKYSSINLRNDTELLSNGPDRSYYALYWTSVIVSIYAIPLTLLKIAQTYFIILRYGYYAIGQVAEATIQNTYMEIALMLFLPSLLGLLIGSRYNKHVRAFVYICFGIYLILSIMSGDRGDCITRMVILIWAEVTLNKEVNWRKALKMLVIAYIGFCIMSAVISLRNAGGFSIDRFVEAISNSETNPLISAILEFGRSMSIVMILVSENVVYPYGNSYFVSAIEMFGTGITNGLLGLDYVVLQEWFSKDYLRISYGADFSIIGEAVLNYGVYIAPIVMFIIGGIVFLLSYYPYVSKKNPLKICLFLSIMANMLKWSRATLWFVLNSSIYAIVIMTFIYLVLYSIFQNRNSI